jgi:hypothetical protein
LDTRSSRLVQCRFRSFSLPHYPHRIYRRKSAGAG